MAQGLGPKISISDIILHIVIRVCNTDSQFVDFFQHPRRGLHSVEKVPMLASYMGAIGKPKT